MPPPCAQEPAEAFFMITSGTVAVTRTIRDGAASNSSASSVSTEGIPASTPSTTEGDESLGTFASFIAQQSQSSPSTPEMYINSKRPDYPETNEGSVASGLDGGTVEGGGESGAYRRRYRGGGFEGDGVMPDSTTPVASGSHGDIEDTEVKENRLSPGNTITDKRQRAVKGSETALKGPEPALKGPEMALKGPEMVTGGGMTAFLEREQLPRYTGEITLTRLYEGTFFGEMALIYDEPRNANIRAATKVELSCMFSTEAKTAACVVWFVRFVRLV